jgi:hypothetical protein
LRVVQTPALQIGVVHDQKGTGHYRSTLEHVQGQANESEQCAANFPNLARDGADRSGSALGGRHHLHPAGNEFVYLAVILDAFSKQIVASAKRTQRAIVLEDLPEDSPSEQGSARAASGSAQLGLLSTPAFCRL